ncbi:MAG: replication initiator protein [Microviridae sp.]|nr:MAG: replication initiator protein [Microviridae sp.]
MICKSKITFKQPQTGETITIPCGQCVNCLINKQNGWIIRLLEEQKNCSSSHFLTLTYDDETLPIDDKGQGFVLKHECQLFIKRLRKNYKVPGIKYYLVADYGDITKRPHYHCIIFNLPINVNTKLGMKKATHELDNLWQQGHVDIGTVTPKSIRYVTRYVVDKNKNKALGLETWSLISLGIGKAYLSPQIASFHHKTRKFYYTNPGGSKVPLPNYYKDKLFSKMEKQINAKKLLDESIKNYDEEKYKKTELGEYALQIQRQAIERINKQKLRSKL